MPSMLEEGKREILFEEGKNIRLSRRIGKYVLLPYCQLYLVFNLLRVNDNDLEHLDDIMPKKLLQFDIRVH